MTPVRIDDADAPHIFRAAPGHLPDTPAARAALLALVSDEANFVGRDRYGTLWYAKVLPGGRQLWAQVRGDRLRNGGLNDPPRNFFSPLTGFARER